MTAPEPAPDMAMTSAALARHATLYDYFADAERALRSGDVPLLDRRRVGVELSEDGRRIWAFLDGLSGIDDRLKDLPVLLAGGADALRWGRGASFVPSGPDMTLLELEQLSFGRLAERLARVWADPVGRIPWGSQKPLHALSAYAFLKVSTNHGAMREWDAAISGRAYHALPAPAKNELGRRVLQESWRTRLNRMVIAQFAVTRAQSPAVARRPVASTFRPER